MRYAFLGAVESSETLLRAILTAGADVAAVGTLPPELGRERHSDYADIGALAGEHGIPVHWVANRANLERMLEEASPDCLLVFGWSRLVPMDLVDRLPLGGIGFHPAPLPLGRGRHPVIWTIALGMQESAVTFFRLSDGADSGDILAQTPIGIDANETARSLMNKILETAAATVPGLLAGLDRSGLSMARPQAPSGATEWRKRNRSDGRIDFRMGVAAIDRLVRALSEPYPGAEAEHADLGTVTVWRVAIDDDKGRPVTVEPGRVVAIRDGQPVVCADDGLVRLIDYDTTGEVSEGSWFC